VSEDLFGNIKQLVKQVTSSPNPSLFLLIEFHLKQMVLDSNGVGNKHRSESNKQSGAQEPTICQS